MIRLAQAVLCRALLDAKSKDAAQRAEAQRWLTCRPNRFRELILAGATNVHQDWIDDYVRKAQDEDYS